MPEPVSIFFQFYTSDLGFMSLIFPPNIHHTLFVQKGIPRNIL